MWTPVLSRVPLACCRIRGLQARVHGSSPFVLYMYTLGLNQSCKLLPQTPPPTHNIIPQTCCRDIGNQGIGGIWLNPLPAPYQFSPGPVTTQWWLRSVLQTAVGLGLYVWVHLSVGSNWPSLATRGVTWHALTQRCSFQQGLSLTSTIFCCINHS